ncbi:hypothetical protein GCM10011488_68700 [Steroidobacter agaridevorans]|nr:hypothetical protein GCM10011488_68700 [Steroidobacter agaridevorans]
MRNVLDARFKDPYTDSIDWHYFCHPQMYTYFRTKPEAVFPPAVFGRFTRRLRAWCMDNLGLVPSSLPYLHLMVNGCRLGLHSDFHNGTWGYVYSLTYWGKRQFSGGETLLMRDGIPSYKKHHVQGEVLYELIPAEFNQLFIFDDRIVHATPTIEGSMNPLDGRIALVGHIRATSPVVNGALSSTAVRATLLEVLPKLRDRLKGYTDVQGVITYRIDISPTGKVSCIAARTDNIVTASAGYGHADAVVTVNSLIQRTITGLNFPAATGHSVAIVALLIPLPDLRPIEIAVSNKASASAIREWAAIHLGSLDDLEFLGHWEGNTFVAEQPITGQIRIGAEHIEASFDAPMWVPSQREAFERTLNQWLVHASSCADV